MALTASENSSKSSLDAGDLAPLVLLTATTSHDIAGPIGGFVEWTSQHEQSEWEHEVHAGVTIGIGDDWQLDAGATTDTGFDNVGTFIGATVRR